MTFECEPESVPFVNAEMDRSFCTSDKETQDLITWAREVKKEWERSCRGN
jgi:hypothetical protein